MTPIARICDRDVLPCRGPGYIVGRVASDIEDDQFGFAEDDRGFATGHLDRCEDRSGSGPKAICCWKDGVTSGREQLGPVADCIRRHLQVGVVESLVATHDHQPSRPCLVAGDELKARTLDLSL